MRRDSRLAIQLPLGHPLGRGGHPFYNFDFRLYQGSVKSGEVGNFLPALLRPIPGPLWIIGDRRSAHRSQVTRDFLSGAGERWWGEYLPGYAPELNPVE